MVRVFCCAIRRVLELCIRPFFPALERLARPLRTDGRQDFLLGVLASHVTHDEVVTHLNMHGFERTLYAWIDDGQYASLRKKCDAAFQYHIRIFNDGEVRGHYEYAPEYAPIKHLRRVAREDRTAEFQTLLTGLIAPCAPRQFLERRFELEHVSSRQASAPHVRLTHGRRP